MNTAKEKRKQTYVEKYGVENFFSLYNKTHHINNADKVDYKQVAKKTRETCLEKYGVENVFQLDSVKEKTKQTNLDRYGAENIMQTEQYKKLFSVNAIGEDIYNKISSREWWDKNYTNNLSEVSTKLGVSLSCANIWAHKLNISIIMPFKSQYEIKVGNLLDQHNIHFLPNNKNTISPYELDIYIPDKNLAIEVNGIYWHSEITGGKDKNYHLNKLNLCLEKGITLLQFWDSEIIDKWEIVSSMIMNRLGLTPIKIPARKCVIKPLNREEAHQFFNDNHLQGTCQFSYAIGLFYGNELVSSICFIKSRFSTEYEWELARFANKKGISVIGGFSKLLKSFNQSCVSYADRRYSEGNLYHNNGFALKSLNKPSYHYINLFGFLENRLKYQKHKLKDRLQVFDASLSEWENMKMNGYDRIWDCGTKTFIYK